MVFLGVIMCLIIISELFLIFYMINFQMIKIFVLFFCVLLLSSCFLIEKSLPFHEFARINGAELTVYGGRHGGRVIGHTFVSEEVFAELAESLKDAKWTHSLMESGGVPRFFGGGRQGVRFSLLRNRVEFGIKKENGKWQRWLFIVSDEESDSLYQIIINGVEKRKDVKDESRLEPYYYAR